MKKRPGIMIYFTMRQVLSRLSNEDKGILFDSILQYADTGTVPELPDSLYVVWPLIQMNLLQDDLRYRHVVIKRKYAAYVRWAGAHFEPVKAFPVWARENGYDLKDLEGLDDDEFVA